MQMIGRWRTLGRFLRELFVAADEDSDSLSTDSRTLMAGYKHHTTVTQATLEIFYYTVAFMSSMSQQHHRTTMVGHSCQI